MRAVFAATLPLVISSILLLSACDSGGYIDSSSPPSATTSSSSPDPITMSAYQRISTGMSYRDVTEIIGRPGVEISSAGNVINYQWSDEPPGGMILAAFMDDKLASKGQVGLR